MFRVTKSAEAGGGTAFADLVWKPVVLVEMKQRGADLQKHFRQAFDYWTRLTGGRPRYVVLCNFDECWIYDFDSDLDAPKDKLALADLPERWGPLAFLAPSSPSAGHGMAGNLWCPRLNPPRSWQGGNEPETGRVRQP